MKKRISGIPMGARLNNPLNIKRSVQPWQGEDLYDPHPTFVTFVDKDHGYRAAFIILYNYFTRHNVNTVRKIISRWAPPSENKTDEYIKFVCSYCSVKQNEVLSFTDAIKMCDIVTAMAHMETNTVGEESKIRAAYEKVCLEKKVTPSYLAELP